MTDQPEAHAIATQAARDLLAVERSPLSSVVDQIARALVLVTSPEKRERRHVREMTYRPSVSVQGLDRACMCEGCPRDVSPHSADHFVRWSARGVSSQTRVCDTALGATVRAARVSQS